MLQLVLETALDGVIVMHGDGRVADWNGQAEVIFGWRQQEAIGAEMASLIIPERYREAHRQGLERFLATGQGPLLRKRIEITGLRKTGEEFPIELSISPTTHNGKNVFLGFIRDISARLEAEKRQSLLLAEFEHRTKNLLAVVMGVASQTAKTASSVDDFTKDYIGRLSSLSRAYGLLTAKSWQAASLRALLAEVVAPHLASSEQLEVSGEDVLFPAKAALAIGMVFHELTTNAVKYGALRFGGKIRLSATVAPADSGTTIRLVWQEAGVTRPTVSTGSGFGTKLIMTTIRRELKGDVNTSFESDGIRYECIFPLPSTAPEQAS